jgi:hypothetical protein
MESTVSTNIQPDREARERLQAAARIVPASDTPEVRYFPVDSCLDTSLIDRLNERHAEFEQKYGAGTTRKWPDLVDYLEVNAQWKKQTRDQ